MTTNPHTLTSISLGVNFGFWLNFLLQDGCYKIFRAHLSKQAFGLLTLRLVKVVRVLAWIPVDIFASSKQ
jgi:hypothetical protein